MWEVCVVATAEEGEEVAPNTVMGSFSRGGAGKISLPVGSNHTVLKILPTEKNRFGLST